MKKIFLLFFFIMFVIGTDSFILSPLLPLLQKQFHVDTGISGWMVSSYAVGYALFALIAGPLSDLLNRKKVMLWGMLAFSVSTMLCGTVHSFWNMNVFRFAAGVSAAFVTPQVWASIPILVPKEKILRGMGIATAGLSISQMLGLPIGSYLASIHWSVPFFCIGSVSIILSIIIFLLFPDIVPNRQTTQSFTLLKQYSRLLNRNMSRLAFLGYFIFQLGNFGAFSFLGTWLSDQHHLTISQIGNVMLFLGLGNTVGSLGGSTIVHYLGKKRTMYIGICLSILLYIALPYVPSTAYIKADLMAIFIIWGTLFPLMMSLLQTLSDTSRGTIAALANALMYSGTTFGAALAGILYTNMNSFISISLFASICFFVFICLFATSGIMRSYKITR
ncbi:MFS transporter [Paenibacillus sediminis]|uniref:MFS family arabinose efflux permease n=1 Tax=Paenibacillus sediminis TaxID=664909 RepID=A0ABS4H0T9_9BACL|nr:MFS transporter [Paenibacillus sediminis]MBP1935982.1 putative MFS family arabinose efflux permease [Paenibacillus sediminis]